MAYTLYFSPGTASMSVHWMLIELNAPHEIVRIDFAAGEQRGAGYLALNPSGRVPTLVVDGTPHNESTALLMLLAERHPAAGFAPEPTHKDRAKWLETMIYLANGVLPPMRDWFYSETDGEEADAPAVKRLARGRIEAAWARFEKDLADGREFLLGPKLSTVDLQATMLMRWSRNMPNPATTRSNIAAYVQRMRARPAFRELCRREGLTEWLNA